MAKPSLTQVRASAGSGKTYRLTSDYIDGLLSIKKAVCAASAGTILAVTFTNAAAKEMRDRVLGRLKEAALAGERPDSKAAARWLDVFLKDPEALNIRTIDSVLHQIVRASALDLKIPPDYEIEFRVEDGLAPYVEYVLELARRPGKERDLLANACRAILDLGGGKGFLGGSRILKSIRDVQEATLLGRFDCLSPAEELESLKNELPELAARAAGELIDLAQRLGMTWKGQNARYLGRYAEKDFPKELTAAAKKKSAAELFKAGNVTPEAEAAYGRFRKAAEDYHYGTAILDRGLKLKPFVDLSRQICSSYRDGQDSQGVVVQSLVPAWASQLLSSQQGVSDSLCRMGTRLSHFLVDEFQDTSAEQWQVLRALVLEALSRGGSFTWVGDVKQSIYGWRGGDPRLFDAPLADRDLTAIVPKPQPTKLKYNRRSLPKIVEHTNKFFLPLADGQGAEVIAREILGKDATDADIREAAARIASAFSDVEQKIKKQGEGFYSVEETGEEGPLERLSQLLLDDIGPRRPWSDVMILVRSNDRAAEIAEHLGAARIPVITENGLLLNENALVSQIIAFLSFLENPADDVSFWAVIKGSIFAGRAFESRGVDLADRAAGREGKGPLYRWYAENFHGEWRSLLQPFLHQAGLMTAYDTVQEWHRRMDIEHRFPEDGTMLRRFLEIVHLAENSGFASVGRFLEYWREKGDEEKAPMPENMNAVRIMTVHKAKGLEAPVVIVPYAEYTVQASDQPVIFKVGDLVVASRCTKETGPAYFREMTTQGLEALNLLYVAFTRPEEELYVLLSGVKKRGKKNLHGTIRKLLEKAGLELPYSAGSRKQAPEGHLMELAALQQTPDCGEAPQPSCEWRPMDWLPRLKIYHTELASTSLTPRQRGTILHACLEYMNFDGDPEASAGAALKSGLSAVAIAIPEAEIPGLYEALLWFAENAPVRDWLERGWREQPLVNAEGDLLRADMIVQEPFGPLVIDYKSGEPHEGDVAQIREYMSVLAKSGQFSGSPCGLLVYLDKKGFKKVRYGIDLEKNHEKQGQGLQKSLPVLP